MENSQASYNSDSGFYIGQTPKQTTPERSIVRNVKSFGNVLGFSGTNMRYVTITKSQWFNNGTGIVPNALDTEKYAPPEDNVITDNDIFWNNFNYYAGAPFKLKKQATVAPYPVGVGVLLFGGRRTEVSQQPHLRQLPGRGRAPSSRSCSSRPTRPTSSATRSTTTSSGSAGPTSTAASCSTTAAGPTTASGPTSASTTTTPADGSTFAPCPFTGRERVQPGRPGRGDQLERRRSDPRGVLDQAPARPQDRPHAAGALQEVRLPIAIALTGAVALAAAPAVAVLADAARAPQKKRIEVVDNFYSPRKLTVNLKSRINWVWTDESADVHDVKLISAPKGFKKFQTEPGSAGYTYSKTLTKPGVYKFICTLHEEDNMRMTITVRH